MKDDDEVEDEEDDDHVAEQAQGLFYGKHFSSGRGRKWTDAARQWLADQLDACVG